MSAPFWIILILILLLAFLYDKYHQTKLDPWQTIAQRYSLDFRPAKYIGFSGISSSEPARVEGIYCKRKLKLDFFWRDQKYTAWKYGSIYSRIVLSVRNSGNNYLFLKERIFLGNLPKNKYVHIENKQFDKRFLVEARPGYVASQLLASAELQEKLLQLHRGKEIKIELKGRELCYTQFGIESDIKYLEYLFDLLCELAVGVEKI